MKKGLSIVRKARWTLYRLDIVCQPPCQSIIVNEHCFCYNWHTVRKMPANYNVVRFAQFVINTWLGATNHKNSQLKGINKWKIYTCYCIEWPGMGERKTFTKLQGERRMVCEMLNPKSDEWPHTFARWQVSSKRGLRQFRQANTNISERYPKTVYPWFWQRPVRHLRRVIPWCCQ